jgi:hypothetical protein
MCVTDIFLSDMYVNDSHEGEGGATDWCDTGGESEGPALRGPRKRADDR